MNSLEHYDFNYKVHHLEFKMRIDTEKMINQLANMAFAPKDLPKLLPGDEIISKILGVEFFIGNIKSNGTIYLTNYQIIFVGKDVNFFINFFIFFFILIYFDFFLFFFYLFYFLFLGVKK